MRSLKKINLPKYLILTNLTTLISLFFVSGYEAIIGIYIVFLGTIVNHLMLVESVLTVVDMGNGKQIDKFQLLTLFFGKLAVIGGAVYLGWHFMGDRVIVSLINYVIHIFFLTFCFRKES